jgi:hypothetical protein
MDPQKNPVNQPEGQDVPENGAVPSSPAPTGVPAIPGDGQTIKPEGSTVSPDVAAPTPPAPADPVPADDASASRPEKDVTLPWMTNDAAPDPLPVTPPKKRKKGLFIGLIVAAVILVLSGGAAASYYYYVANKPENVLKQALANSMDPAKAKTMHATGSMVLTDENMTIEATYNLATDSQTGALELSGTSDAVVTTLAYDVRSTDGKTFYFKIGGLDGLSELLTSIGLGDYMPLIDLVNDQWFEVNESMLSQFTEGVQMGTLTAADRTKIAAAYNQHSFLVIKETLPDETIGGKAAHHYKVAVDPAVLKAFVAALKAADLDVVTLQDETITEINKVIDQAEFDKHPFEVWIDKADKLFAQFKVSYTEEEGSKTDVKLTVESYNQPVQVEKPEDAKSVLELMAEFTALFSGGEYSDLLSDPLILPESSGISL